MEEWQPAFLDFEEREDLSIVLIAIDDRLTVIAARDVKTTLDFNFAASGPWRADFIFRTSLRQARDPSQDSQNRLDRKAHSVPGEANPRSTRYRDRKILGDFARND